MSKRKGAVALAACAFFAVSGFARAAEPVETTSFESQPLSLATDAEAPTPMSVLNEQMFDRTPLGKIMKDTGIKAGGWVEGSYTYNFRAPRSEVNEGRVFDFEHNAARLNQVALQFARPIDMPADAKAGKFDIGFGLDMMYGSDARLIHSNGLSGKSAQFYTHPINQFDLTQAYVDLFFPVGTGLKVRLGKFVTIFGNETIAPIASVTGSTGNALYSHSYQFGFGIPFTHTGILATYAIGDKLTVNGGITRGWEQSTNDNNGAIDFLGGVAYTLSDEVMITGNVSVGPQKFHNNSDYRYLAEVLVAINPKNSPLSYAVDALGGREDHSSFSGKDAWWYSVAGYAGYKLSPMFTVNGRVEWFRDDGGSRLGVTGNFYEGTIGVSIKPFTDRIGQNLVIRPELRGDYSSVRAFGGGTKHDQATAAVDAVFAL
jgi:hypothetical protein